VSGEGTEGPRPPFRTIGITTDWTVSEVRVVVELLEALHAEIATVHGTALARAYHEQAAHDAALDAQQPLALDEPPF